MILMDEGSLLLNVWEWRVRDGVGREEREGGMER